MIDRRAIIAGGAALAACAASSKGTVMYGLIGKIEAVPGKRDDLARILLEGVSGMPGCLSYTNLRWS
jgi:hypothetical protein